MRVRVVTLEFEVLVTEREDVLHVRIDLHHRQGPRRARQLQARLIEVVGIKVGIAERVNALLADPARASEMGRAGRARAIEEFAWTAIGERTAALYRSVTGQV